MVFEEIHGMEMTVQLMLTSNINKEDIKYSYSYNNSGKYSVSKSANFVCFRACLCKSTAWLVVSECLIVQIKLCFVQGKFLVEEHTQFEVWVKCKVSKVETKTGLKSLRKCENGETYSEKKSSCEADSASKENVKAHWSAWIQEQARLAGSVWRGPSPKSARQHLWNSQ